MRSPALAFPLLLLAAPGIVAQGASFKRGDANASDKTDLSDAVYTLNFLFTGGETPSCLDAADVNDSGKVDISDPVSLLNFLFLGGAAPLAPYPDCGPDPTTGDAVDCAAYAHCAGPPCYGQADLDKSLAESVAPVVCIPGGSVDPIVVGGLTVTVCPLDLVSPCPTPDSPDLGCPVEFTEVQGELDVPGKTVTVHIAGVVNALPVIVDDGFGTPKTCHLDATFGGDVVVALAVEPGGGGSPVISDILEPTVESASIDIKTTDPFPCTLFTLPAAEAEFLGEVIHQLQAASQDLLADLRAQLIGKSLCPAGG